MCWPEPTHYREWHFRIVCGRRMRVMQLRVWQETVAPTPLRAILPAFAGRKPSEIPSRTRSVSAFLPGQGSVGPRSSGEVRSGSCQTHGTAGIPTRKSEARREFHSIPSSIRRGEPPDCTSLFYPPLLHPSRGKHGVMSPGDRSAHHASQCSLGRR